MSQEWRRHLTQHPTLGKQPNQPTQQGETYTPSMEGTLKKKWAKTVMADMPVLCRQIYQLWGWDSADWSKAAPLLHTSPQLRPRSSTEDSAPPSWGASNRYCCDFYSSLQTWHPFCPPAFKKSCSMAIEPPKPRASLLVSTPLEGRSGGKGHEEWNSPRSKQGISEWSTPSHLKGRLRQRA